MAVPPSPPAPPRNTPLACPHQMCATTRLPDEGCDFFPADWARNMSDVMAAVDAAGFSVFDVRSLWGSTLARTPREILGARTPETTGSYRTNLSSDTFLSPHRAQVPYAAVPRLMSWLGLHLARGDESTWLTDGTLFVRMMRNDTDWASSRLQVRAAAPHHARASNTPPSLHTMGHGTTNPPSPPPSPFTSITGKPHTGFTPPAPTPR